VAKAMAKGANVDKLAAEFADELDNLGVRVAKLEKKADNVKITGQIRAHYRDAEDRASVSKLRTRLFVNGTINEDWSYTGRLQNEQEITHNNEGDDTTKLNWAFVTGKIGGAKVTAGRQDFKMHTGSVFDATVDGISVAYGKDVKVTGYAAKGIGGDTTFVSEDRLYAVDVAAKLGVIDGYVTYYKACNDVWDQQIYVVGASTKLAKDLKLSAEYLYGKADAVENEDNSGYMVGLAYKGAKATTPGSWGLWANYYNQPAATYLEQTTDGYTPLPHYEEPVGSGADGFKGIEIGANYALAKNIVAGLRYYDFKARVGNADEKTLWSEVIFTF
ncbi:MAG: hypothetical protein ACI3XH_00450, partial [Phascolarctobacterium sp.]